MSYFGDTPDSPVYREDALKTYEQVKEQVRNYVKKQKQPSSLSLKGCYYFLIIMN